MTMYNNPYAAQQPVNNLPEGSELVEGTELSAAELGDYDKGYILLPEGDYNFTVVNIQSKRFQPGPNSKIGACKQIILTLRVLNPESGDNVDLEHNLYMWNSKACTGMIAQFYDSIGTHKKGDPIRFDWRPAIIVGKTGRLKINHRVHRDDQNKPVDQQRRYNNIKELYPKEEAAGTPVQTGGYIPGKF